MISDPKGESDCEEGKHEPKICPNDNNVMECLENNQRTKDNS